MLRGPRARCRSPCWHRQDPARPVPPAMLAAVLCACLAAEAAAAAAPPTAASFLVEDLPGLATPPSFKQYAGFMPLGDGAPPLTRSPGWPAAAPPPQIGRASRCTATTPSPPPVSEARASLSAGVAWI